MIHLTLTVITRSHLKRPNQRRDKVRWKQPLALSWLAVVRPHHGLASFRRRLEVIVRNLRMASVFNRV